MTRDELIMAMRVIVDKTMERFKSDFEEYDRQNILYASDSDFPMLWFVGKTHTHLLMLGSYRKDFFSGEALRYLHAAGTDPFTPTVNTCRFDRCFILTDGGITEVSFDEARRFVGGTIQSTVSEWEAQNGPIKLRTRMPVQLFNIRPRKLIELIREGERHGDTSLIDILRRFRRYQRTATNQYIQISYHPGHTEFMFRKITDCRQGLTGGIIFHGWPETGYQENDSVQLCPSYGWSVHT